MIFYKRASVLFIMLILLSACGADDGGEGAAVIQAGVTEKESMTESEAETEKQADPDLSVIDLDLTKMSSTMVYGQVFNMISRPQDFEGKIVRIEGEASSFLNNKDGKMYYACIIRDALACCAQGMEFRLRDGFVYPEDGERVVICGAFNSYEENGQIYCQLIGARLEKA